MAHPRSSSQLLAAWAVLASLAHAGDVPYDDPTGRWKTVDDRTGRERSIVRIDAHDGVLTGRVEQSLDPNDKSHAVCDLCKGSRKDQPIIGMAILTDVRADGDTHHWSGGEILDPDNGQVYRVKLTLSPDGRNLTVRGFIGISLIGRSQNWVRIP